jgi:hypothetical protein
VSPHGDEPADVELPPGGAAIFSAGTAPAELTLRRYATEDFPINVATVSAHDGGVLRIPTDRSDVPWTLGVSGGPVRVCGVEGL